MSESEGARETRRAIALGLLAFVVTRAWLVLSVADVFGYGEEFAKGAAAKVLLDDLGIPHHQLAYAYHEGGGFLVSHLTALLFAALGPSVLAVKLAALLVSSLVFAAALRFAAEHLERKALGAVAAAFVLAPLGIQRATLLSLGTHFAAMLFVLGILGTAARLLAREKGCGGRSRDAWALGLWSGLGVYVSALAFPAVAAAALALAWRRVARADAWRALAGFALGALPLWWMLSRVGLDALGVRAEFGVERPRASPSRSLAALFDPLAGSSDPWAWAAAAAVLALAAIGLARVRPALRALVLGYLLLHAAAYVASGMAVRSPPDHAGGWLLALRAVPLWLFGVLFAAGGAAHLARRGDALGRLGAATFALALVPGARSYVGLLLEARPTQPIENLTLLARARGYSYSEYFGSLRTHLQGTLEQRTETLLRLRDDPRLVVPAVAEHLHLEGWIARPDSLSQSAREVFGERTALALLSAGRALHGGWTPHFETAFARLRAQPAEAWPALGEALGRTGLHVRFSTGELERLLAIPVPAEDRADFLRGVGWRVHQTFRFRPDLALRWLDAQDPALQPGLRTGYQSARDLDRL
jgi:hypothetical protein